MTLLLFISAAIVILLSGFTILKAADRKAELAFGPGTRVALSFLLGLGGVSQQMFLYSLASVPFSFFAISLPWVVSSCALFFLGRKSGAVSAVQKPKRNIGYRGAALIMIIASQAVYAFVYAGVLPVSGWDAWAIWFLKAKAFYIEKSVAGPVLTDGSFGYSHPDYPLLAPLSTAWVYVATGGVNDIIAKLLYPVQYVCLLTLSYHFIKKAGDMRTALLFTALLSVTPIILIHSAGFPMRVGGLYTGDFVGYADLALSIYFLGAASFIYLYARDGKGGGLILAGLMLSMAAWTKNEGLVFAITGFIVLLIFAVRNGHWRHLGAALAVLLLFVAPWAVYKSYLGAGSEYSGRAGLFFAYSSRLPLILKHIVGQAFFSIGLFSFTWWVWLASTVINIRGSLRPPLVFLNAILLAQLAVYVYIYVITPADLGWHLSTSSDRLLLQLTPLAMAIAALNVSSFFSGCAKTE